ncbi:hypothetical protein SIXOD_v1c12470 [Spiroplasma ixodetis Y32]|nr:hypothetical protein SIXOD_v1c12470 [Spiroplasma ixodetis Y32]
MLKIFISYHHLREQKAKDELSELILECYGENFEVKDVSVKLGDIDPQLPPKKIFKRHWLDKFTFLSSNLYKLVWRHF